METKRALVDSEIWPNLIINVKSFQIPLAIINARITSKSFKRWMIFQKYLKKFSVISTYV